MYKMAMTFCVTIESNWKQPKGHPTDEGERNINIHS